MHNVCQFSILATGQETRMMTHITHHLYCKTTVGVIPKVIYLDPRWGQTNYLSIPKLQRCNQATCGQNNDGLLPPLKFWGDKPLSLPSVVYR